jgi:hypothetical protein
MEGVVPSFEAHDKRETARGGLPNRSCMHGS